MPRSRIAGSYGGFIPSFLRNLHTISIVAVSIYIPTNSARAFPFIVCRLFDEGHSDQCEVVLSVVLICISLIMSDVEYLFMCLLAISLSSLEKCL